MKKILALLLALSLLLTSALVGCDKPATGENGVTTAIGTEEISVETVTGEAATTDADTEASTDAPSDAEHTDRDDDGSCDECGESVIIFLDMFVINDLHGKLCDANTHPGVDEMTTYLKNAYATKDHVLLLSSGDMWQGSSESNLTHGLIVTDWMNELDFVSMTLGNHEFDWGEAYIRENAALAEFPLLAINIYDRATNQPVDYCQPSVMVQRGGATIGIIGAIGDCHSSISGEHAGDFYFKVGSELAALVKAEAQRLREAGADFIIYSLHDGYSGSTSGSSITDSALKDYYEPVLSEGYVDIVFEGHTHYSYVLRDDEGVYHLQNGGDNKGLSTARAKINFANGNSSVEEARFVPSREYSSLQGDDIVLDLMDKYEDQVSEAGRVLGWNDRDRNGDALRQLVADLYLEAALEAFGADYDIVLGGAYMTVRSPGYLPMGEITFSQVQGLFPFENRLVLCSVKGSDLLRSFIRTTNGNYFISYSDYGLSVRDSIDPNGTYYILTDTYSSTYAPNRLTEVAYYTEGVYAHHLLAEYIKGGGLGERGSATYTTIPEALEIGNSLSRGETTDASFYVEGRITSIINTTWGNLYIEDEDGNSLFIYGLYDSTGAVRYDTMENPPAVGDTVCLYGPIMRYYSSGTGEEKIEMTSARLISVS